MIVNTNENAMSLMARYGNKHFDLAPVDPPYFSGPEKREYYGSEISTQKVRRRKYGINKENWQLPDMKYFNELKRVSENQIIWGANYFDFIGTPFDTPRGDDIHKFIEENPIGWIVWDKCNGKSSFNDYELAWTSFDRPTVIFKYMWNGMMQGKSAKEGHIQQGNKKKNEIRIHPTQKPVILYKWILVQYAKPGDIILDTHLGSGSIAIACLDYGFDLTSCDIDKPTFLKAQERIKKHQVPYLLYPAS